MLREDLEGDRPIEAGIGRFVDVAHAAGTDRGLDFIRPETSAGTENHRCMEGMGIVAGRCDGANRYGPESMAGPSTVR